MKKVYFGLVASLAVLASCDPLVEDKSWSGETMTEEQLANGVVIRQYGGDKSACDFKETEAGNWIEFSTNPSKVVRVYYKKKDGSVQELSSGKPNGLFFLKPARGSELEQTLYFETREFDGSSVTASVVRPIEASKALTPEQILLCSNAGKKVWTWDDNSGMNTADVTNAKWGNMGADATHSGNNVAGAGFCWWGVEDAAELVDQSNHAVAGDFKPGEADNDASMEFAEDGTVKCFDKDGNVIRSGSWEIQNWDPTFTTDTWKAGTLKTSEGATLFPYEINGGGKFVTEYEIHVLTPEKMLLVYPDGGEWSKWQEATFWAFKASDPEACITTGVWTWDDNSGMNTADVTNAKWGNMGADATHSGDNVPGAGFCWWGVEDAAELEGQVNHAVAGDFKSGEANNDATMVFDASGLVSCYDADGNEIRKGSWSIDMNNDGWKLGTLITSEGATLFPYEINGGGKFVTEYEIHTLSMDKMLLVYPDGGEWSKWQEATFWAFKKK